MNSLLHKYFSDIYAEYFALQRKDEWLQEIEELINEQDATTRMVETMVEEESGD